MADRPARIFGITSSLSGVEGYIINSYSENETVESARAQDEKGKVLDIAGYTQGREITMEALCTASSEAVHAGSAIDLGDRQGLITSVNKTESNTDFQRAQITAQAADVDTVIHPLSEIQGS